MTRANLTIKSIYGNVIKLNFGNSANPSTVGEFLHKIANDSYSPTVEDLATGNPAGELYFGFVGNPSYIYEVDQKDHTVKGWSTKTRWVNAPENWKEKGWNCYIGENGKYGYPVWIKGKPVEVKNESET